MHLADLAQQQSGLTREGRAQSGVRRRVVAQEVTRFCHLGENIGVILRHPADNEERRLDAIGLERGQNLARVFVGSVIERQRDRMSPAKAIVEDVLRLQERHLLTGVGRSSGKPRRKQGSKQQGSDHGPQRHCSPLLRRLPAPYPCRRGWVNREILQG